MAITVAEVKSAVDTLRDRTDDMLDTAGKSIDKVLTAAQSVVVPGSPDTITLPNPLTTPTIPDAPTLTAISLPNLPTKPTRPVTAQINPQFSSNVPQLTATKYQQLAPVMPTPLAPLNLTAPVVTVPSSLPTAPNAFSINVPTATTITLPSAPAYGSGAEFKGVRPDAPVVVASKTDFRAAFSDINATVTANIDSSVSAYLSKVSPQHAATYQAMASKLLEFASGQTNTGISPAAENAVFERSKSKTSAETIRVQQTALESAAKRGFTLPSGALMSAMQQARQAGADANSQAAREIVAQQAELQQKNMQFALSTINELVKVGINASLSFQQNAIAIVGQSIQYASALSDALLKVDEMAVRIFNAKLDGYKADADVFGALVQASLREVEIYKARLQGEIAKTEVDKNKVAVYQAQVDAHKAAIETYVANIQGITALANLEKIKVEVFQAQVQSFQAQAQAKAVEFQGYVAAWNGEEAKSKAYMADVQAYSAQVEAFKATIAAESERVRALGMSNQSELGAYEAEIRAYGAEAQANASVVAAKIDADKMLISAYDAASRAAVAKASAEAERFRTTAQINIEKARAANEFVLKEADILLRNLEINNNTLSSAAGMYEHMAASALSGSTNLLGAMAE